MNLDIGHFTAANYDPIAYMREHHADITNLHIKDRKSNQGDNTPWGTGDTKIKEVLALMKREKWPIRAYIEYEYRGTSGAVEELEQFNQGLDKHFELARLAAPMTVEGAAVAAVIDVDLARIREDQAAVETFVADSS